MPEPFQVRHVDVRAVEVDAPDATLWPERRALRGLNLRGLPEELGHLLCGGDLAHLLRDRQALAQELRRSGQVSCLPATRATARSAVGIVPCTWPMRSAPTSRRQCRPRSQKARDVSSMPRASQISPKTLHAVISPMAKPAALVTSIISMNSAIAASSSPTASRA